MIIEMNAVNSRTGNGVLRRGVLAIVVLLLACTLLAGAVSGAEEVQIGNADDLVNAFINKDYNLSLTANIDMTGKILTPIDGNLANGEKEFILKGNGYTISNLQGTGKGLFVNHTGSCNYSFYNVHLKNCTLTSSSNYGALFVGDADTSDEVVIQDCTATDCTVKSGKYAAAFIAYTAGYGVQNNGPVYSDITIKDCKVHGGSITGGGSTGVAIAHSGGNHDTSNTITNLEIENVLIKGEDREHTGIVIGTAGVGKTWIAGIVHSGVTGTYLQDKQLYGRFVPAGIGKLYIGYILKYDPNGGAGEMDPYITYNEVETGDSIDTYQPSNTVTLPECTFTPPAGKQFKSWMIDNILYDVGDSYTITKDNTVAKAVWEDLSPQPPAPVISSGDGNMNNAYRVLFETNGGSFIRPATDLSAGDKITAPANPVKDGYTFAGWYKDEACTQGWDFTEGIPGDMSLYAKWTADTPQTTETAEPTAKATAEQTAAPTKAPATTAPTAVATTAAPAATTAAGVSPTLTQAPAPVLGALLGLLAAGVLIRRRE